MKKIIALAFTALLLTTQAHAAPKLDIPAGDYTLDKSHASLVFKVNHIGFSNYTGQFASFDAKLKLDPAKPQNASVEAEIDPTSIVIPAPPAGFKEELIGEKWLNAKAFPKITFRSTKVEVLKNNKARITGDLTLHGVTKPVVLNAKFNGGYKGMPPYEQSARVGFSAEGVFNRSDFGISYGIPEKGTTMGVSDAVTFQIEAEFKGPALAQ